MKTWTCGSCKAVNDVRMRVCDNCGAEPVRAVAPTPMYQAPPVKTFARALPTDRCTEDGCTKTVAEHQAELKAALQRIYVRQLSALGYPKGRSL